MKKRHTWKKLIALVFCVCLIIGLFPASAEAAATTGGLTTKQKAYIAYYEYMQEEIERLGTDYIQDKDYYKMFTNKCKNAVVQELLAAYLLDVNSDGIEELILKRYVTHESSAMIDFDDNEWLCIYTYANGKIKRIGQNSRWAYTNDGGNSWGYYEPEGFIGDILSSKDFPNISNDCLWYCKGSDGRVYLIDRTPDEWWDEEPFTFFTYYGNSVSKVGEFQVTFLPEWDFGSIESSYGTYYYEINDSRVSESTFFNRINSYTAKAKQELVNNDYRTVYNKLKKETAFYYTPSDWAVAEINAAIANGYVPDYLQKAYGDAITRAEFCALATSLYETMTGREIEDREEFVDTDDVNMEKMAAIGVITGVGEGMARPNDLLTREQAATILYRLADNLLMPLKDGTLNFADSAKISDWAKDAVADISAAGVMNGIGGNKFDPSGLYTREQAMVTIERLSHQQTSDPILVTGVELNVESLDVIHGQSARLTATVMPENASDKSVKWYSSDEDVVTVNKKGELTTIDEGEAIISVEASGYYDECVVTVLPVEATGIALNRTTAVTNVGNDIELLVTLTPSNASMKHLNWSSSDESVATVSDNGIVTAHKDGTAVITVETFGVEASCTITVTSEALGLENFVKKNTYRDDFSDVAKTDWFYENVKAAYELGLMNGKGPSLFDTYGNLSIAEAITIASRLHNVYYDNNAAFKNPEGAEWYECYVDYAIKNKIIEDGAYSNYEAMADRMTFANILAASVPSAALAPINNVGNGIPDVPPEMEGADAVYLLYNAGILNGSSAYGNFEPDTNIQRCAVAAIITRIADPSLRKTFTLAWSEIPAKAVKPSVNHVGIIEGETETVTLTMTPSNSNQKVRWTTANRNIATVDQNGVVTGVSAGTTTITATVGKVTTTITVEVAPVPLEFSGTGNRVLENISLEQGAYYYEYTHTGTGDFTVEASLNYTSLHEEIEDVGNCSGIGFIQDPVEGDMNNFGMKIQASGDWTIKIYKLVDKQTTTSVTGNGSWVSGRFVYDGRSGMIKMAHEGKTYYRVYMYDLTEGKSYSSTLVSSGSGTRTDTKYTYNLYLDKGHEYVFVITDESTGNWTLDFNLFDPQK